MIEFAVKPFLVAVEVEVEVDEDEGKRSVFGWELRDWGFLGRRSGSGGGQGVETSGWYFVNIG